MKKRTAVGILAAVLVVMPGRAFEQTSVKLFEPVAIAVAPDMNGYYGGLYTNAEQFGEKQVYLSCEAGDTASISGANGAAFVVDNYVQVQRDDNDPLNFCPNLAGAGCFNGVSADPMALLGYAAETAYYPVAAQDVSAALAPGVSLYTFRLMDWGYTKAASEVWLNTTCVVKDKVCHKDAGKPHKTLTVGASAIRAHLAHGDRLGACGG